MRYIYSNRSKNPLTWFLVVFSTAYAVIGVYMIVAMTLTILDSTKPNAKVMLFFIPFIILLVIGAVDLVVWQIAGREIVEISSEGISVKHKGRIFRYRKFIPIDVVKQIRNESNQIDMMRDFWFPKRQSFIKVIYDSDNSIRIGRNLSKTECAELLNELQKSYPNIHIETETPPHKLTLNEILFIIWAVGCVFLFIPAWFVVPVLQEKHDKERIEKYTERMAYIRQNYQKMYCYSNAYDGCCYCVHMLKRQDSIYEHFLDKLCLVEDSLAHFSRGSYSTPKIMPDNVSMPSSNFYRGVVFVFFKNKKMSLVYSNTHLYEPVFVLNRYLHNDLPKCKLSDCIHDDIDRLRWDETDNFIKNGSLWKLGIVD